MPKKKSSQQGYGGFILTFEPGRAAWLADRLYPDMRAMKLSESFSSRDWEMEQRELMFLMFHAEQPLSIGALVLLERMRGTGGFATLKMRFAKILTFDEPVPLSQLNIQDGGGRVSTPGSMKRLDQNAWVRLLEQIKSARPGDAARLDAIVSAREAQHRLLGHSTRIARLNEQRDGLGLALDIGGLDRASILKSINVEDADTANSIVDLMDDAVPIHERSLVEHDQAMFESLLGQEPDQSVLFSDGRTRSVRVWVTDQTDLETVLGTDLIVYSTCHENFLLLQYKRMEKNGDGWSYAVPPSSHLHEQLGRMMEFQAAVQQSATNTPPAPPSLWSYRLNEDPCYFKFCEQVRPNAGDSSLVPGITMSAVHLDTFLTLPEAKGKQDGIFVGYQNCPRYLNNTEFIQLAQTGWIGGGHHCRTLLEDVLRANKNGGRKAMLAVIDTPREASASARNWKK